MTSNDIDELVLELNITSPSETILFSIGKILQNVETEKFSSFVVDRFRSLLVLENWTWHYLSRGIEASKSMEFFEILSTFNHRLIFTDSGINFERKLALLSPNTTEIIDKIVEQLRMLSNDEDHPYFHLISLCFDNMSHFADTCPHFMNSPVLLHLSHLVINRLIMTEEFKSYIRQLTMKITLRQIFFLKSCSFFLTSYIFSKSQLVSYTGNEVLLYLAEDFSNAIRFHTSQVSTWSKELFGCLTHLISFICTCCWWGEDKSKGIQLILSTDDIAHQYIQSLIRILDYRSLYEQLQLQLSNDSTILIDSVLGFLLTILETQNYTDYIRSSTNLVESLLLLANIPTYIRTCLCIYALLGEILSDEQLKALKVTDDLCRYFFHMLQTAWQDPLQKVQCISTAHLLKGFLNLSKNDTIQAKMADCSKISLFVELCDQYPAALDIVWALSFHCDVQEQLRTNPTLLSKLKELDEKFQDEPRRKMTQGILWNLESNNEERSICNNSEQSNFDIMISYSHKDKVICKQLYDQLIKLGYRVWIDFDQMHGNVMDAMAYAIDRSNAVVICMSEQYRRSNYCRAEAHYAFQRQTRIIPVLVQKQYKPDGWLLFLVGQLLYVDFTKHEFNRAMSMLAKELKPAIWKEESAIQSSSILEHIVVVEQQSIEMQTSRRPANLRDWSSMNVYEWLIEHNLKQMSRLLVEYDGKSLIYLNRYLTNGELSQTLALLQDDAVRCMNENLSLVEFVRFRALLDEQDRSQQQSRTKSSLNQLSLTRCNIM